MVSRKCVLDMDFSQEGDVPGAPSVLQDVRQRPDVARRPPQRRDLGHGGRGCRSAAAKIWQDAAQRLEGFVDLLHAVPLAGVGCLAAILGKRRRP